MVDTTAQARRDYGKWAFFVLLAIAVLAVINVDERFLIDPTDGEWKHIQPFQWLLLPHGLAGTVALFSGPFQFSDKLRMSRPALHRGIGWTYVTAVSITAAMGFWISMRFEPPALMVEEYFHSGLILMSVTLAILCIRSRNMQSHKLWMMRSYGVALVFVFGRLWDVAHIHLNDEQLNAVLWSGDVVGFAAPDVFLTIRDLMRRRARAG